jgi:hypothetical protein
MGSFSGSFGRAGPESDWFEGFARLALTESFLVRRAGQGSVAQLNRLANRLDEGLADARLYAPGGALDPARCRQVVAELHSLWLSIRLHGRELWDHLSMDSQQTLLSLARRAIRVKIPSNNWMAFRRGLFLALYEYDPLGSRFLAMAERCDSALQRLYVDGGWYSDGGRRTFDYYNSMAFHYYELLEVWMARRYEREYPFIDARAVESRAEQFLDDLILLLGPDGQPLRFGRSLTYRTAIGASLSAFVLAFPSNPKSGIYSLALRRLIAFFFPRSFSADGSLEVGWLQNERGVAQAYSGPFSSYWAGKAFVHLLADPVDAGTPPAQEYCRSADVRVLPVPGILVVRRDHEVLAAWIGSQNDATLWERGEIDDWYESAIYSSQRWPGSVKERSDGEIAPSSAGRLRPYSVLRVCHGVDWVGVARRVTVYSRGSGGIARALRFRLRGLAHLPWVRRYTVAYSSGSGLAVVHIHAWVVPLLSVMIKSIVASDADGNPVAVVVDRNDICVEDRIFRVLNGGRIVCLE